MVNARRAVVGCRQALLAHGGDHSRDAGTLLLSNGGATIVKWNEGEKPSKGLVTCLGPPVRDVVLGLVAPEPSRTGDLHPVRVDVDSDLLPTYPVRVVAVHHGVRDGLTKDLLRNLREVASPCTVDDSVYTQVTQDGSNRVLDHPRQRTVTVLAVDKADGRVLRLVDARMHSNVDSDLGILLLGVGTENEVAGKGHPTVASENIDPLQRPGDIVWGNALERLRTSCSKRTQSSGHPLLREVGESRTINSLAIGPVQLVLGVQEVDLVGSQVHVRVVNALVTAALDTLLIDIARLCDTRPGPEGLDGQDNDVAAVNVSSVDLIVGNRLHLGPLAGRTRETVTQSTHDRGRLEARGWSEAVALVKTEDDDASVSVRERRHCLPDGLAQPSGRSLDLDAAIIGSLVPQARKVPLKLIFSHFLTLSQ